MLSRITAQRKRRSFMVYDMEWIPGQLEVRLLGLYDGERYRAFYKVDDFLNAVLIPQNADKWFYAHYGGMADAQFLLQRLASRADEGFKIEASFSGSSAIIINVTRGELSWHFIDSFWLLRDRLAKIGEAVGLDKLGEEYACDNFPNCGHVDSNEMKYLDPCSCGHTYGAHDRQPGTKDLQCLACGCRKYDGDEPYAMCVFWAPMGELQTYNERDCVILFNAIKEFEQVLLDLGGQLQMTIASCAMHLFRRKYLQEDIRTVAAVNRWARKAYTSSRVEVFQSACQNAHYYDLNSSFPYAMTFECPGNVKRMYAKKLPPYGSIYLAECEIIVPEMYLPPLPFRHDGRVFFPTGRWTSWFSNIDLELLQKRGGRIVRVIQSIEFEKQSSLRDYAIDIYAKRKAAKTSYEKLILKYLLNSLYGKFGERTTKTSMLLHPTSTDCPHEPKHRCDGWPVCPHAIAGVECNLCIQMLFPGCLLVTNEVELAHEWVPIAVHITATARKNLEGHLWNAQEDIYYCDTDSVITTVQLPSDPTTLGALKLEDEIRQGEFIACKIYAVEVVDEKTGHGHWKTKAKGFSKMNYSKFIDVKLGNDIKLARMTRIRELYRKGKIVPEENIVAKRLVQKCMAKRCMLPDGQSRPWTIEEIQANRMDLGVSIDPMILGD